MASSERGSTRWSPALILLQELLVICCKGLRDIDLRLRQAIPDAAQAEARFQQALTTAAGSRPSPGSYGRR
jgi:hypothetical protein